jgi:uncharacterized phage protein (TIGR01671 family)
MREIKFRSYHKKYKKMLNIEHTINMPNPITDSEERAYMQFTGLFDKNNKEIYEGDICKFEHRIKKICGTGRISWEDEGGYWKAETTLPFLMHTADSIEVIGNIYENPELLK